MQSHEPDISIIIVNWNTRDILRDCLRSIYAQTRDITFEVIVIDNASSDESAAMVKAEFPHVTLIENTNNRGFAAANNQGIAISKGRYILLLNSDTVILDHAIQKTLRYAEVHPDAGVFGCKALWPDGRWQSTCFRFPSIPLLLISSLLIFRRNKLFICPIFHPDRYLGYDFDREHDVDVVAGCFFLIRREVIASAGQMDESFFMYGEEAEWCYRIRRNGWLIRYFPGAEIIHLYGASSLQVEDETRINKRRGTLKVLYKTRGCIYAWLGNLIMTVGVLFRLPFWLIGDMSAMIFHRKLESRWGKRFNVVLFHVTSLFVPAWKVD